MKVDWQKINGMLPVVVQDNEDGAVLMLAYMNKEALALTLQTGFAHYFSRSKKRIWKKGEESGHVQIVKSAFLDCDNDTLLLRIEQVGGSACHTGERSCFFKKIDLNGKNGAATNSTDHSASNSLNSSALNSPNSNSNLITSAQNSTSYHILDELYHVCLQRRLEGDAAHSYTASLYAKGENAYLKKITEEAGEFVLACKDLSRAERYVAAHASTPQNLAVNGAENSTIAGVNLSGASEHFAKDEAKEILDENGAREMLCGHFAENGETLGDKGAGKVFGEHKAGDPAYDVIYEGADILYHTVVALAAHGVHPSALLDELARREGVSGIEEKRARKG